MYNRADIINCLTGLVGFKDSLDPCLPMLSSLLIRSDSGLYVNDEHPLITPENIQAVFANVEQYNYDAYDQNIAYTKGKKIKGASGIYASLVSNNTGNLLTDETKWRFLAAEADYNHELELLYRGSILKVANSIFEKKLVEKDANGMPLTISGVVKPILQHTALFEMPAAVNRFFETKTGKFTGWRTVLSGKRNIQNQITQLGVCFTEPQTALKIYLYHNSQKSPIAQYSIDYNSPGEFRWVDIKSGQDTVTIPLSFRGKNNDGGTYYIGYYENDIAGQAIYYRPEYEPCQTCNGVFYKSWLNWQSYGRYMQRPQFFYVDSVDLQGTDFFGDTKIKQSDKNFGLNAKVSVYCDVTEMICSNRQYFAQALSLQMACDILEKMLYSTRINYTSEVTKTAAMYELNGSDNQNSLTRRAARAIEAVNFTFSGFDPVCLPCGNKGIYTRST